MTQILPEHGKELNEGTAKEKCITEFENIHYEIFKPDLPRFSSIDQDWRKMINNECFSDLFAISKDKCKFYLHSLVLSVRCPVILKKDYKFLFAKFNLSIILVFLEYLYCGTLNNLNKAKLKDLMDLGRDFDCKELVDVLNCLEVNLEKTDDDSFNVSEITTKESNNLKTENTIFELEDKDLFEDEVVDLTQSSRESSLVSDGEKLDLSYKNYNHEKEKEKELLEEKNDKLMISFEMEKIQTSMNQQNEIIQKILSEFEEVHTQNSSKSNQPRQLLRRESNYSNTKDVEEFISENKINENCIILSSDSETVESKPDNEKTLGDKRTPETSDCDVSYSEPFHMSDFNFSPVDLNYKSIITGQVSKNNTADLSETLNAHDDGEKKINATSFILRQTCGVRLSL